MPVFSRPCRWLMLAFLVVAALSFLPPAHAERDLVFAAQYFRQASPRTLQAAGFSHLYRINADGSRRTRLTFGKQTDIFPQWSPDGKRVLFLRVGEGNGYRVCLVNVNGGKVTSLFAVPDSSNAQFRYFAWAPNGRTVAVVFVNFNASLTNYTLYLIDVATHKVRQMRATRNFAWSPDSMRLYLDRKEGDQILEVKTGKIVRVAEEVDNPFWLDNQNLVGTFNTPNASRRVLRVINARGKARWSHRLATISKSHDLDDFGGGTFLDSITWHRNKANSPLLIAEWQWDMSDGQHYGCYTVDYRTGQYRLLHWGQFVGFSARTGEVAIADDKWVGEYKRGGQRVGPIQLVSLKTRRTRTLTHGLSAIAGGDWRVRK